MKRFLTVLIIILLIPTVCFGADDTYNEYITSFDLSFIDELSNDVKKLLEELDLTGFDYEAISDLNFNDIVNIIKNMFLDRIKNPLKSCVIVLAFVLLSALFKGFDVNDSSSLDEIYSTISAIVIGIVLLTKISSTIEISVLSLSVASNFIYAFIPAFCCIIAVGGGVSTSFSTNTTLLILSQALSFISSKLFMPIINSFLAISICSGLKSDLNLGSFLSTLKRSITTAVSFVSAMFVSILSIKTSVTARSDILGIRSIRFVINTVVPVIGGSISEGLLSIHSYSSLIKSSVGIVGIIAVSFVFLPAIIEVVCWRMTLSICSIASDIFCDKSVSMLINAFKDTLLLINVVLILSMVTTIISIGILIASRTV